MSDVVDGMVSGGYEPFGPVAGPRPGGMFVTVDPELTDRRQQGLRFGPAARDYQRGRPTWPAAALTRVAGALELPATATVVDLGAGTGQLTRLLADRFAQVVAVEPLPQMRQLLSASVPRADVRAGTAEQLPLPDGSADAVFAAESFHWFDAPAALAEASRVLRPAGGIALLWNEPAGRWQPALPEPARQLVRAAVARGGEPGGPRLARLDWQSAFTQSAFGELHHEQVSHELRLDQPGVIANLLSISSIAGLPEEQRRSLRERLHRLIPPARYRRALHARLYWARLGGSAPEQWCDRCGDGLRVGGHASCDAARAWEPPRYCRRCRRRMKVQVLPAGWSASCVAHGEVAAG